MSCLLVVSIYLSTYVPIYLSLFFCLFDPCFYSDEFWFVCERRRLSYSCLCVFTLYCFANQAGDFLRNLLAKFDSMGSSLSSNSTLLSNTNDCVFSEIVNACQGHPLRFQTIVGWISLQIQSGTVQSISEAWKLFTSLVNTQSSPAHTSSRDWLGSILETLSPLHKSILHCLVLFNGKVSIGFPMLVSLLTGALHSVEKAFGSLALDRNEVFSKNSVPEYVNATA